MIFDARGTGTKSFRRASMIWAMVGSGAPELVGPRCNKNEGFAMPPVWRVALHPVLPPEDRHLVAVHRQDFLKVRV